jgi:type I restriction enzyme, S subunit
MKTTRLDLPVKASWMESNGRRLDCNPYLSGAFEAKIILEKLSAKKEPLQNLTLGGMNGLINAGRITRNWVNDPEHGLPFLSSTDILQADLSNVSLIAKKAAKLNPKLIIRQDWTLITRSGSIGRMAYCRSDMDGMACTEDVLRVVPDPDRILPGYLYAYLSSKFGVPIVVSGTYGAIIQHIEPHHIADLPVPRLGDAIEGKVHELVVEAAKLRTEASSLLNAAIRKLEDVAGLPHLHRNYIHSDPDTSFASSKLLVSRLDGLFHSSYHKSALDPLMKLPDSMRTTVDNMIVDIIEPKRLKRIQVDNPNHGVPFFGTTALMWVDPEPSYYIPKRLSNIGQYTINENMLLVPRSGQLSGLIGHPVLPYGSLIGGAVSEHAIRVVAKSKMIAGYLFIALVSEYGRRQLKSRAFGSSIPTLDVNMIRQVIIPKLPGKYIEEIGNIGWKISQMRSEGIQKEHQARQSIEVTIQELTI